MRDGGRITVLHVHGALCRDTRHHTDVALVHIQKSIACTLQRLSCQM
jgi:hypothetical protein